ncbi:hypothetical protein [Streptomyces sp. H34-S4]|uniref:hypothetical protein n=1 Tax=Streptomyces sp. H34-S4 TaxID=2996463 RepID=UPI00226DC29C|nr:hypothetical protein [Streptomyces sp. H34-S4]MCY0938219.1 hypothetical protein [Streptomyces sp. H34-S4]
MTGVLLLTLLSGALLILQSRRGAVRRLPLEQPGATLTGRALRSAVADRLGTVPGAVRA